MTEVVSLGEVVRPIRPRVKPEVMPDAPFIGMEHVEAHTMKLLGTVPAGSMKSSAVHFKPGDVLYGRLRPYLNKVFRPSFEGLCSAEFIVLPENERIDGSYLQYFLNSSAFVRFAASLNAGDRPRVDFDQIAPYKIPLPSLTRQREIVAEIEKQFSRLDEAVANLQRVKANLKRYKASVLKAAVVGRLVETEASIAQREGRSYETGEQLLQRILEERRAKWSGRGKYKEPDVPDPMPVLPKGWTWATLDTVCSKITDGTHHSPVSFPAGEFKYVTSKNVREFRLDLSDISYVPAEVHEEIYARCDVRYRDVLYVKDGASTGLAAVNTLIEPFSLLSSVGVFRPLDAVDSAYMAAYLNCSHVRDEMLANIAGVAITRLTLSKLKVSRIAVPPRAEQTRIVAEVDRHLSIIREVEAEVDANLQRVQALRQSTLSKAFT